MKKRKRQFWASLGKFGQVWTSLGKFGQVWASLDKFGQVWASLGRLGQVRTRQMEKKRQKELKIKNALFQHFLF